MVPYYQDEHCTIYCGDCRAILPTLSHGRMALVLTDPQWGVNTRVDNGRFVAGRMRRDLLQARKPIFDDNKPFDPAHLLALASRLILWGAHNYASRLPDSPGWLVWDKRKGLENSTWPLSDSELAWTNVCGGIHTFRNRWFGLVRSSERGEHFHLTQKPIALMRWGIEKAKVNGGMILDPYMGAGSTLLAARELGFPSIGIDIDEQYCATAVGRLKQGCFVLS